MCCSFNLTANHSKHILHTNYDHPTILNNKTIVLMNKFNKHLRKGNLMIDNVFELYKNDGAGYIFSVSIKMHGYW